MHETEPNMEDKTFAEFRRKARDSELLSAATEKLLRSLRFSGNLNVVVRNGCVLKSGYKEDHLNRRLQRRFISSGPGQARGGNLWPSHS